MNYREAIDFLYSRLPMFHRIGAAAYKADLNNTIQLCALLGNPEAALSHRSIHIAGTNGKGSVSHMLAAILQTAGYKTGLYTSPHLLDFRERIRINGKMIPEQEVISFIETYQKDFERINPSFFEWTVALAFNFFAKEKVDVAVIETGLGGRLDSTNVITPLLSIITNIGLDHTNLLGNSFELIAAEKAGIIKHGIPVIIGETQSETKNIFLEKAKQETAEIIFADEIFSAVEKDSQGEYMVVDIFASPPSPPLQMERGAGSTSSPTPLGKESSDAVSPSPQGEGLGVRRFIQSLHLDLTGDYQLKNIVTVIAAMEQLKNHFSISGDVLRHALKNVRGITGLMGRWQILKKAPLVICDVGHNAEGIAYVVKQIKNTKHDKLHFVFGAVDDKDISKILKILPLDAEYYFCRANIPRAVDSEKLTQQANEAGLQGKNYGSVSDAVKNALQNASLNDLVFIGGSTFVVAEAMEIFI
jgi:dihydrofolate synthase/folylpolyglutamate synthase